MSKTRPGNFFEDFSLGQRFVHATPRTVTEGDVAMYLALYGSRFALTSSTPFARRLGLERAPVDNLLAFHLVFGKSVPDISLNAIANLGYADCRFGAPLYPGDTVATHSEVTGLKENRDGKTGVVYVRSVGTNQRGETVVAYDRWVMVPKRDLASPPPETSVPKLPDSVPPGALLVPFGAVEGYDLDAAGSADLWEDYEAGERIDHVDGMTVEDTEHMMAARLYQNTARVHFNDHVERRGRFGRRIVYGGHVISVARALSFNGLANAQWIAAIHGGRHASPTFAGDTLYAWTEVLESHPLTPHFGALRLRTIAAKDRSCSDFPRLGDDGKLDPSVVLELDLSVLVPRRAAAQPALASAEVSGS